YPPFPFNTTDWFLILIGANPGWVFDFHFDEFGGHYRLAAQFQSIYGLYPAIRRTVSVRSLPVEPPILVSADGRVSWWTAPSPCPVPTGASQVAGCCPRGGPPNP